MEGKRDEGVGGGKREEKIGFKIIKFWFESQPITCALRPQPVLPTSFTLSFYLEDAFSVYLAVGTISSTHCRIDSSLLNSRGITVGADLIMSTKFVQMVSEVKRTGLWCILLQLFLLTAGWPREQLPVVPTSNVALLIYFQMFSPGCRCWKDRGTWEAWGGERQGCRWPRLGGGFLPIATAVSKAWDLGALETWTSPWNGIWRVTPLVTYSSWPPCLQRSWCSFSLVSS